MRNRSGGLNNRNYFHSYRGQISRFRYRYSRLCLRPHHYFVCVLLVCLYGLPSVLISVVTLYPNIFPRHLSNGLRAGCVRYSCNKVPSYWLWDQTQPPAEILELRASVDSLGEVVIQVLTHTAKLRSYPQGFSFCWRLLWSCPARSQGTWG